MAEETMAMGKDPKFLCGVAVSVYQNSGAYLSLHVQHEQDSVPPHRQRHGVSYYSILLQQQQQHTVVSVARGCKESRSWYPLYLLAGGDPNANWAYFQEQKQAHINLRLRLSMGQMTDFQEPGTNTGTVFAAKFPKLGPSKIVKNSRIGVGATSGTSTRRTSS